MCMHAWKTIQWPTTYTIISLRVFVILVSARLDGKVHGHIGLRQRLRDRGYIRAFSCWWPSWRVCRGRLVKECFNESCPLERHLVSIIHERRKRRQNHKNEENLKRERKIESGNQELEFFKNSHISPRSPFSGCPRVCVLFFHFSILYFSHLLILPGRSLAAGSEISLVAAQALQISQLRRKAAAPQTHVLARLPLWHHFHHLRDHCCSCCFFSYCQ